MRGSYARSIDTSSLCSWYSWRRSTDSITSFRFVGFLLVLVWRANWSRFSTIPWQRRALPSMRSRSARAQVSGGDPSISCENPRIPESGLFSSCATPLTSLPIALSFSDW